MRNREAGVFVALCLLAGVFSIAQYQAPEALPLSASPKKFSAFRAIENLRTLTSQTHALGTPGHEQTRKELLRQIRQLGLTPEIQDTSIAVKVVGWVQGARVQNVMLRIPGQNSSGAVMLSAHYDAVSHSMGASDDGSGTVTLLETLRAIRASGPLRNDVIALWTDGEELGLLGATAFLRHPWSKDVAVVLNFEARGSSGPSAMFEVGSDNGFLIRQFAEAVEKPIASSMIGSLAKLIPNDTDMSAFRSAGMTGLNFAYAQNIHHYHTPLDNIENLDPRSLQHHGDQALALLKRLGNADLSQVRAPDLSYFTFWDGVFVYYSYFWVGVFALILLILFVCFGPRRPFGFWLRSLTVSLLAFFSSFFLIFLFFKAFTFLSFDSLIMGWTHVYFWAFFAGTTAMFFAVLRFLEKKNKREEFLAGTLLAGVLLSTLTAVFLPGMAYLFTWPAILLIVGRGLHRRTGFKIFLLMAWLPVVILYSAFIYIVYITAGPISLMIPMFVLLMLYCFLSHELVSFPQELRFQFQWGGLVVSVLIFVSGILFLDFSPELPRQSSLEYLYDSDEQKSYWTSSIEHDLWGSDSWTRSIMGKGEKLKMPQFSTHDEEMRVTPSSQEFLSAPLLPIELSHSWGRENQGSLRLKVIPPLGSQCVLLWQNPNNVQHTSVKTMSVEGLDVMPRTRFGAETDEFFFNLLADYQPISDWKLMYCGAEIRGFSIDLEVHKEKNQPFQFYALALYSYLPDLKDWILPQRPAEIIPSRGSDRSRVSKQFTIF